MNGEDGFASSKLRVILIFAMFFAIILYLYGVFSGFSHIFGFYKIIEIVPSITFIDVPGFFFESYPGFTILNYSSLWYFDSRIISPLGVLFLVFAASAMVLLLFGKPFAMHICSLPASFIVLIQYVALASVVGSAFWGYGSLVSHFKFGFPILYLVTLYFNNNLLLLLPLFLIQVAATIYLIQYLRSKKIVLSSEESPSSKHFATFQEMEKITHYTSLILNSFVIIYFVSHLVISAINHTSDYTYVVMEFPILSSYEAFIAQVDPLFWIFFLFILFFFWTTILIAAFIFGRFSKRLIHASLPLFAEKIQTSKSPIVTISELQEALGLTYLKKDTFKTILTRMIKPAKQKAHLHFNLINDYLYLKTPLQDYINEELEKYGSINTQKIASDLKINPRIIKKIIWRLINEKILPNTKLTEKGILQKVPPRPEGILDKIAQALKKPI
ncbi:MAG: hypothetical protein Q6367_010510 [Candidatus Freyarchaeota archaeon]